MLNIDLTKARPADKRRGEVIDWPSGDAAHDRDAATMASSTVDEGTAEQRLFAHAVAPWLTQEARVIEIGPGAGKWTVRIAPLVQELVVVDVSESMLERTQTRLQAAGIRNVSCVLGSGRDLRALPAERFDLVFGYDVFVHITLEDTVAYLGEIARVLRDGGLAVLHHAVNDVRTAWDRIEAQRTQMSEPPRAGYQYHSRDALDRMYGRFGLRIESVWTDACTTVVSARRPTDSVVPKLEQALRLAASAEDDQSLDAAMAAIQAVGRDLTDRLEPLAASLAVTSAGAERIDLVQRIRRLVRG